jgi:anhydro-N-acetylmuramic acid kinase
MAEILKVIGLMSGTSLDGVDAAVLETDGEAVVRPLHSLTVPYKPAEKDLIRQAIAAAATLEPDSSIPEVILEAERLITAAHGDAANLVDSGGVDLIGFHGQTILHRPERRWTWQIGDGAELARMTGHPVVNDFRSADVRAGGQGAPLVPLYHAALARNSPLARPLAIVNIGGVANVTYISGDTVLAFDTGPGNAPIDDWMQRHTGKPIDNDGSFASTGTVSEMVLTRMLDNPFFVRVPPKSLDRMDFGMAAVEGLSPADGAATLTAFTAASIARAREHFPDAPLTWIVCGGGRHNKTLMAMLQARVNAQVLKAEGARWDGDALEAEAFGYLAVRSLKGLPLSLPTTTGVAQPMTGGKYWKA